MYDPILDEIDYKKQPWPFKPPVNSIVLPNDKKSDPFEWASICREKFANCNPRILIPGKKFDIFGTRHGRGYGWYDRFLSKLPTNWQRVGVTNVSNLHFEPIDRESWDESVDWIIAFDASNASWKFYETRARLK